MQKPTEIRQALAEVWQQRAVFSPEALGQITLALLDRLRRVQTAEGPPDNTPTMDEIRLVTVMFVDVKDSTTLAQQLESDWKGVLDEAHRRIAEVVNYWEGEIGQYLGDGALCFFGAQRSRGDDALRCASCALAIHSAIEAYANEVFLDYGLDFAIRIGISTGRMVVGMIGGAEKQELLALGPATNLAARLQSLATPGSSLVDSTTYARIRNYFVLKPRPPIKAKGFEQPIANYLLVGRRNRPATQLTSAEVGEFPIPLVGRQSELDAIRQAYQQANQFRRVQMVMVSGDLGMGKSRLLQEALNQAHDYGLVPLVVQASYELRAVSYNLIRHLLARQCSLTDEMSQAEAEQTILEQIQATWNHPQAETAAAILGYLGGYGFSSHAAVQPLLRGGSRAEVGAQWLARYLHGVADDAAPLLVIDNLQWTDAESVEVLTRLLRDWRDEPLIVLMAARSQWRESLPSVASLLEGRSVLLLEGLTKDQTHLLIESVSGHVERVPHSLTEQISRRAEGNPLFVIEFLGMLLDHGVFYKDGRGQWRFNLIQYDSVFKNLPEGLLDIMQARLDDLPAEARQMAQVAAVVGQTFWGGMLSELMNGPPDALLELLSRRGIITRNTESSFEGEAQYSFRHSLYRDVAYEMIPRAKREQHHRQVARWLVSRIADKPEYFGTLADQFMLGNQNEAALATYLEAAQNRVHRGFYGEVMALIDRALSMAKSVPRDVALSAVAHLWAVRAQALIGLSRFDEARAAAQSSLLLLEELPDDQLVTVRVQAARLQGNACRSLGLYDEALEALSEAYELLDENDNVLMTSVLRSFGALMFYRGRLTDSLAYQERAYQHAQATRLPHLLNASRTHLGIMALERGDIGAALTAFEEVRLSNEREGFMHFMAHDWQHLGQAYMSVFNLHRARAALEEARLLESSLGHEDSVLTALYGLCLAQMGESDHGVQLLWEATRRPHRDVFSQQVAHLLLLEGLSLVGDWVACLEQGRVLAAHTENDNPLIFGRTLLRLGRAMHALAQPGSLNTVRRGLELEQSNRGREVWLGYLALAEVSAEDHQRRYARQQARQALIGISDTLKPFPAIHATFREAPQVRALLDS